MPPLNHMVPLYSPSLVGTWTLIESIFRWLTYALISFLIKFSIASEFFDAGISETSIIIKFLLFN